MNVKYNHHSNNDTQKINILRANTGTEDVRKADTNPEGGEFRSFEPVMDKILDEVFKDMDTGMSLR